MPLRLTSPSLTPTCQREIRGHKGFPGQVSPRDPVTPQTALICHGSPGVISSLLVLQTQCSPPTLRGLDVSALSGSDKRVTGCLISLPVRLCAFQNLLQALDVITMNGVE